MIVDQTNWGHIETKGDDRIRFLQGMCTANVETIDSGGWARASVLDHRGRVQSIVEIANRGDHLLISCEPGLEEKTRGLFEKYAIMDDVVFTPVALPMHRVWNTPEDVWNAPPVFAVPDGTPASEQDIEIMRIEAGMPRYDVDVSADHFPFESLLSRHIDYEKGCYLGQEPVSRVHHRGKPSKAMRGLKVHGDSPVSPGARVSHTDRENAGKVTSSVVSPRLGVIALAYIHRSVNDPGTLVDIEGRQASIVELPF